MPIYSETVMDHFTHPRNVGEIENPDGVGEEGNPVCGDMMTFYIRVKDDRLADIKFKTFGCGAAIAVSSMVSEMAMGKTLEEALKITPASVAEELKGLPKNKFHCSNLGAQALGKAIHNYLAKTGREKPAPETAAEAEHEHEGEDECHCPFCEADIADQSLPYCQACKAAIKFCSSCGKPVSPEAKTCPHCGSKINS
jgi:nitrogen fixation protein NifU and related proteins